MAIAAILQAVSVQARATHVVFTGGDGCAQTIKLSDRVAGPNALVAIDANGCAGYPFHPPVFGRLC